MCDMPYKSKEDYKKWEKENRDKRRIINRRHRATPEYRRKFKTWWNEWYLKNKEKVTLQRKKHSSRINARQKLRYHIKVGHIKKLSCEICGSPKVEGHHEDYSKPLKVIWLCREHHAHKRKL